MNGLQEKIQTNYKEITGNEIDLGQKIHHIAIVTSDQNYKTDLHLVLFLNETDTEGFLVGITEDYKIDRIDGDKEFTDEIQLVSVFDDSQSSKTNYQLWTVKDMNAGLTMNASNNRQIVALRKYNKDGDGIVEVNFLYSGVDGERRNKTLELSYTDRFELYNEGELVKRMHFKTRQNFIGITVGIKKILFNENAKKRLKKLRK